MKASLFAAIIGIIALFLLTQLIEPQKMEINEITTDMAGINIITQGTASNVVEREGHVFFSLISENSSIKAVLFENDAQKTRIPGNNEFITVHGEVALYKGELEIIVKQIE